MSVKEMLKERYNNMVKEQELSDFAHDFIIRGGEWTKWGRKDKDKLAKIARKGIKNATAEYYDIYGDLESIEGSIKYIGVSSNESKLVVIYNIIVRWKSQEENQWNEAILIDVNGKVLDNIDDNREYFTKKAYHKVASELGVQDVEDMYIR